MDPIKRGRPRSTLVVAMALACVAGTAVVVGFLLAKFSEGAVILGDVHGGRTLRFEAPQGLDHVVLEAKLNSLDFRRSFIRECSEFPGVSTTWRDTDLRFSAGRVKNGVIKIQYSLPRYSVRRFDMWSLTTFHGEQDVRSETLNRELEAKVIQAIKQCLEQL